MMAESEPNRFTVDIQKLPTDFPTHKLAPEFWESLGRTIATFAFLEEVLGKAIFAFTGTRQISSNDLEEEFRKWLPTLERALIDPLGGLIDCYAKSVRANTGATIPALDHLLDDLRKASAIRNVLCHGSWSAPDEQGRSLPFFVSNKKQVFKTRIDVAFLRQVRRHVVELACAIISSVTHMGWQFPGSSGPGLQIWPASARGTDSP